MGSGHRASSRIVVCALTAWAAVASSCAGPDESPIWSLAKAQYDPYGNAALLSPANDSRVNLLMLLADQRRGAALPEALGGRTFFAWNDLVEAVDPTDDSADSFIDPSRCQSMERGARDFLAALANSKATQAEKKQLADDRTMVASYCTDEFIVRADGLTISSPPGRAFKRYLEGASSFYSGHFTDAAADFTALVKAPNPWLREVSAYMRARTALNAAQTTAFDEYGNLVEAAKRDRVALAGAERGFTAYLKAYPAGRYTASARGLLRRVHWLAGDDAALGADYAATLSAPLSPLPALRLAEEIDYKLPTAQANAAGPLLLAVGDLQRMRTAAQEDGMEVTSPITAAELAGQARAFAGAEPLYDYLRAAHAFHVVRKPAEVLKLIPDAARAPRKSALEFSRQVLRGLALDATGDRNARGFWLEVLSAADGPGQRQALELALARHDEATGGIARVFAADSPVRDPVTRAILLQRTASPALLRQQAKAAPTPHERGIALAVLLAKELTRGFYADFVRDLALLPRAPAEGWFAEADAYARPEDFLAVAPPTDFFVRAAPGLIGCPAIGVTAAALERSPLAPRPRLCLGEFIRERDLDDFPFDAPLEQGLGSSRPLFPGTPITREAIYRGVLGDPGASADDKAYALFRIVNCYAPGGNNACGDEQAPLAERKAWFQRLKRDYPQSRWARELKYYW